MKSTFLPWDSVFFDKKVYRLDVLTKPELSNLKNVIQASDADLCYIFSKGEYPVFHELGAKLVDTKRIYAMFLTDTLLGDCDAITTYNHEETTDLQKLALLSGTYSRFKTDPALSHKFSDMYSLWLTRSLNREIADEVFIYKSNERITGFVTVKRNNDNVGVIGLIAVSEQEQGKSIGKKLVNCAKAWCIKNNIQKLTVATQKENEEACKFYKRCGFELAEEDFIYHLHRHYA